jgi:hypothetical protein
MKKTAIACTLLTLTLLVLPGLAFAQAFTWFVNDGPDVTYLWEDTSIGTFWEAMAVDAIEPGDLTCTYTDLPVVADGVLAYYACTAPQTYDFSDYSFWADLYLSNNYVDHSNPVTVTLGTGTCGQEGSFIAVAGPITLDLVDFNPELDCGIAYHFDLGVVASLPLNGESLILKIEYAGIAYDGHIFWDSECCPSALACEHGTPVETMNFGSVKALY